MVINVQLSLEVHSCHITWVVHFLFRSKTRPPRTRHPNPPFPRASLLRRLSVQLRSGGKWKFSEIGRRKSPSLDIARVRGKPLARRSRVPNLGGWRIMNRAVKFSFILTCWQKFYTVILKQQTQSVRELDCPVHKKSRYNKPGWVPPTSWLRLGRPSWSNPELNWLMSAASPLLYHADSCLVISLTCFILQYKEWELFLICGLM